MNMLYNFFDRQDEAHIKYFKPHSFDHDGLKYVLTASSFLAFGYFHGPELIGYFILRLFANKKIFPGAIVDPSYKRSGTGKSMAALMYCIGQRAYKTVSKDNIASLKTHKYAFVKNLPKNYVLLKYVD